jgi:ATP-binding cassette, subfamily B, bacterial PglK
VEEDSNRSKALPLLGKLALVLNDIVGLAQFISRRRKIQLGFILCLQVVGAGAEILSLGAVIPFLNALTNATTLLNSEKYSIYWTALGIGSEVELIMFFSAVFAGSVVVAGVVRWLTLWTQLRFGAALGADMVALVYRRTLLQPYKYHTNTNSSIIISLLSYDFNVAISVVNTIMSLNSQMLVVCAIGAGLLIYNPTIAGSVCIVFLLFYFLAMRLTRPRLIRNSNITSKNHQIILRLLQESYGSIRDLILASKQNLYVGRFAAADRLIRMSHASSQILVSTPRFVLEVIAIVTLTVATAVIVWRSGDISTVIPLLGVFVLAANRVLPAAQQIFMSISTLQSAHLSLQRTLATLQRPIDPVSVAASTEPVAFEQVIELKDVYFRFNEPNQKDDSTSYILRGLNIRVPIRKTIALVGKTGSGKSTIADILMGLHRPTEGALTIDGKPLDEAGVAAWRSMVAHVPQAVYLSDASFKENIAFGEPVDEIDLDRVRSAAEQAQLADFIEGRPQGYDETVGERGIRISGGQRQRLGIARALYRRASVIILDEATSALDSETESAVMAAVRKLSGEVTMIIIAHRIATIRNADMIYEIDAGRVCASGTYDELIASSVSFRALANQPTATMEN